jgi:hypothetical protein
MVGGREGRGLTVHLFWTYRVCSTTYQGTGRGVWRKAGKGGRMRQHGATCCTAALHPIAQENTASMGWTAKCSCCSFPAAHPPLLLLPRQRAARPPVFGDCAPLLLLLLLLRLARPAAAPGCGAAGGPPRCHHGQQGEPAAACAAAALPTPLLASRRCWVAAAGAQGCTAAGRGTGEADGRQQREGGGADQWKLW